MLDWLNSEGDAMRVAFSKVFGSTWKPFGSAALQIGGFSDDRKGVQWNVAYDPRDESQWVGVNLEGLEYDEWPVARLIQSELRSPTLVDVVRKTPAVENVTLLWHRDYWQATSRPAIAERDITPTPIPLGQLTPEHWREACNGALECLDGSKRRRGRAKQTVTLPSGEKVEGKVSPHLMFRHVAPKRTEWEALMREARATLQPLHAWATKLTKQTVRF